MIKIVTNLSILMNLAKAVGDAKKTKQLDLIIKAEKELTAYEELVKMGTLNLGLTKGDL
jgi:hypothetical protein